MPGLGQTVSELMLRRMRDAALQVPGPPQETSLAPAVLAGGNPGQLRMWTYVPSGLPPRAPLVVVLHGCLQNAAGIDAGTGWSALAARHGFALLLPEQQQGNNTNTCFNWFQPADVTRDGGEVASIAQMIHETVATHALDPARVYVTGLSAGGAMTASMLATYPELFAGGAIIAGLPFGAASSISVALDAMRHCRSLPAAEWGDMVRHAHSFAGRRPPVQIWHGGADTTVRSEAADELVKQWCDVAGVVGPGQRDHAGEILHDVWRDPDGRIAVEAFRLPRLGHGIPLNSVADDLDESVGAIGPYMLEAGIGSTRRIAQSWGLLTQPARPRPVRSQGWLSEGSGFDFGGLIQGALRATGLKI